MQKTNNYTPLVHTEFNSTTSIRSVLINIFCHVRWMIYVYLYMFIVYYYTEYIYVTCIPYHPSMMHTRFQVHLSYVNTKITITLTPNKQVKT